MDKDLIDRDGRLRERLTPTEMRLFHAYARPSRPSYADAVRAAASAITGSRQLPLEVIGNYLQTGVDIAYPGVIEATVVAGPASGTTGLPFGLVHNALLHSDRRHFGDLVSAINAEANILTALICHADGRRPAGVCGRTVVRSILRHVR